MGQRRGLHLLDAPRACRRETPREPGRHDGKIARELGVVAIRRTPLVELRHRLRQREAGLPLAGRILPGTQQALVQLTHVLQQDALGFRPLSGHHACRGAVLWGHRLLLPRWRRPRPAPPETVGTWHRHRCGPHPAPWHRYTPLQSPEGSRRARVIGARGACRMPGSELTHNAMSAGNNARSMYHTL